MIIGIGGWERCLKTGLAAILATHPEELNIPGLQEYHITRGWGNLHLFKTQYPWNYLSSAELVNFIRDIPKKGIVDALVVIDEADSVYNPRDFTSAQQTKNLKGIGQHAKMGNIFIYTYQLGQPGDSLLGVDKILRSNTRVDFEMRYFDIKADYAIYRINNRLFPDMPQIEGVISQVSQYFGYWDTHEPVV